MFRNVEQVDTWYSWPLKFGATLIIFRYHCVQKNLIGKNAVIFAKLKIPLIILACLALCWCIYRDIQLDKQMPDDLRNRVVGARLQMDGHSP